MEICKLVGGRLLLTGGITLRVIPVVTETIQVGALIFLDMVSIKSNNLEAVEPGGGGLPVVHMDTDSFSLIKAYNKLNQIHLITILPKERDPLPDL